MKIVYLIPIIIILFLFDCKNRNNITFTESSDKEVVNNILDTFNDNNNLKCDTNNIVLSEYVVVNDTFNLILETIIEEYTKCENIETGYHFTVSIQNTKVEESSGVKIMHIPIDEIKETSNAKSLCISRSYYKGFISTGYGFFYYKDYLFILLNQQANIFIKTNKQRMFLYKYEPILEFDPPRWLYCYWNDKLYFLNSSPCGG